MSERHECESCGRTADVRLKDGSTWCLSCNEAANRLGIDTQRGRWIAGRVPQARS